MVNNIKVYTHTRLDTNAIFYIGIGSEKRPYSKKDRNNWWKNITNKTTYKIDIIHENLSWIEACKIEKELINFYGRKDLGLGELVNMTDGGDGAKGIKSSLETRKKISNALFGNTYASGNKGKQKSESHKKNMSISALGKKKGPMSQEHKNKLSKSNTGRLTSIETRKKLSDSNKGKTRSLIIKEKLSKIRIQKNDYIIKCVDTNEKFNSFKEASNHFNVSYQAIRQSIINKHLCKGLLFEKEYK